MQQLNRQAMHVNALLMAAVPILPVLLGGDSCYVMSCGDFAIEVATQCRVFGQDPKPLGPT